jgi:hypothetical protein
MGVGSSATGASILVVNEQSSYQTWEFLYDPRIEQLKIAGQLNGGGVGSVAAGSLGQTPGSPGGPGVNGATGFGPSGGNGFGGTQGTGGGGGQSGGTTTQP